jgi:flagellar motor switch/type III secretory pathway protein FliN
MTLSPWQPPPFLHTYREGELWNAILSYRERSLVQEGWAAAFTFSAIEPPDAPRFALLLQPDRGPRFVAAIDSFPFAGLFGADLDMTEVHRLPQTLRGCLEEGIVSTLWSTIPDNRLGGVRIVASGALEELSPRIATGEMQWLLVSIEGIAPEPAIVSIGLTVGSLVSVVAGGALAPAAVDTGLSRALLTEAYYTIGSLPLTFAELAALGPGELVVLPELPPDLAILRAQGRTYAFRFTDQNWVCLGRELTERYRPALDAIERTTTMSQEHSSPERPIAAPDALGVVIDFDLGRMSIPLAQVQTWQPGTVVSLEPPALDAGVEVTIRANGQVIGIGDLVRIDDRIGVRITRLMARS